MLDSGLLYRAYSYCFGQSKAFSCYDLFSQLNIQSIDHEMHVFENGKDITSILRHEDVAKFASELSSFKETRANLISFQRDWQVTMDWLQMEGIWVLLCFPMQG